jgi:RimJ/RimL family protein N-acetyltransferase
LDEFKEHVSIVGSNQAFMQEQIFIESPRLLLRSWKDSDTNSYIKMNLDPVVMKYFPQPLSTKETLDHLQRIKQHFVTYKYGLFALELKEENRFIGFTGFSHPSFDSFFTPCVEIGWRIDSGYWKKGYGTEAARACIDYGFQNLFFDKLYSFTSIHNIASEKTMQNIGMQKLTEFDHPKIDPLHHLCKHVLYQLNRITK